MLAIGQGSKRSIQAQISEMGSNMIMIHPGGDRRGGVRLDAADMESLKLKDLKTFRRRRAISATFRLRSTVPGRPSSVPTTRRRPFTVSAPNTWTFGATKSRTGTSSRTGRQDRRQGMSGGQIGRGRAFPDGESPVGKVIRFERFRYASSAYSRESVITVCVRTRTT